MRLFLLCSLAFMLTICVGATITDDDLKLARSLMRPGYDITGMQQQIIKGAPQVKDWWHDANRSNLVIHDLNGDGRKDVLMVVEENPKVQGKKGVMCEMPGRIEGHEICWGEREIEVHYQQPDGSYRLVARSSKLMMPREGGAIDYDPFAGFTLTPKRSIQVTFSYGTGWTWEKVYTLQFRNDDVYVIGVYESSCSPQLECMANDANLLTGQWRMKSSTGDGKQQETKGVMKAMRPWRLKYAFVEMDPCRPPPKTENEDVLRCGYPTGFTCNDHFYDICRNQ
jgi:hypothetical protein